LLFEEITNEESEDVSAIEGQSFDGIPELDEESGLPFKGPWTNHDNDTIQTPAMEDEMQKDSLVLEERPLKISEDDSKINEIASAYYIIKSLTKEHYTGNERRLDTEYKEYDEKVEDVVKEYKRDLEVAANIKAKNMIALKTRYKVLDLIFNKMAQGSEIWKAVQKEHNKIVTELLNMIENAEESNTRELQNKLKDVEEQLTKQIKEKEEIKTKHEVKQNQLYKEIMMLRSRPLSTISKNVEVKEAEPKVIPAIYNKNTKKPLITPRLIKGSTKMQGRTLTLKQLKELIHDIYIQKQKYDEKCAATKLQRETMEQYMYSYLNQRYGLKNLIIEWTAAIVNGIKKYYTKDSDVQLFWKILRNECDEDYRFIHSEAKLTIIGILKDSLRRKYKEKKENEIDKMANVIQGQSIEEWLWKEILNKMYNEEYVLALEEHIREKVLDLKSTHKEKKKLTREEIMLLQCNRNWSIPFIDFQRVLIMS